MRGGAKQQPSSAGCCCRLRRAAGTQLRLIHDWTLSKARSLGSPCGSTTGWEHVVVHELEAAGVVGARPHRLLNDAVMLGPCPRLPVLQIEPQSKGDAAEGQLFPGQLARVKQLGLQGLGQLGGKGQGRRLRRDSRAGAHMLAWSLPLVVWPDHTWWHRVAKRLCTHIPRSACHHRKQAAG